MTFPVNINLSKYALEQEALDLLVPTVCMRLAAIPVCIVNNTLVVAMAEPDNRAHLDELKLSTGLDIEPVKAPRIDILTAIKKWYSVEQ